MLASIDQNANSRMFISWKVDEFPLADLSSRESRIRERFGVTVVAVRHCSGKLVLNPPPETVVSPGDKIRVFGRNGGFR
jgi:K+/H+ antiporter YhaU regulatory subunit KhtT